MKRLTSTALASVFLIAFSLAHAAAQVQNRSAGTCPAPIYSGHEVTRRARVTDLASVQLTDEARAHDVHGRIILQAILCRTGRVTDLQVIEGLPYRMTEKAIEAVQDLRFTPAEKTWHTVSQRLKFEFDFIDIGNNEEITPEDAAARTIEAVQIIGNRRLTAQQILAWIRSRPGDTFNFDQVTRDLNAIRATGYFDNSETRASLEKGVRDGVVINFEVFELPLISGVKFENFKEVDQRAVIEAFQNANIDLRSGKPYKVEAGNAAIIIIKQVLASTGRLNINIDLRVESVTASFVMLTFVVQKY